MTPSEPERHEPPPDGLAHHHRRARRPQASGPLRRSRRHRRLGGVAGGIATFVDAPPATVRLLWLLSLPLTGGLTGLVYLLLWMILPREPQP